MEETRPIPRSMGITAVLEMACSSPPVSFAPRPRYYREDPTNEDLDSHSCLSSGMYVDMDMDVGVGVDAGVSVWVCAPCLENGASGGP